MERRLTAILAADVVGYSRLMGANETGTLAALKALQTDFIDGKIAEHQGRIVKLTGDGMLVEFPSVVNAVACAADVQRGMRDRNVDVPQERRIEFRIGVNLGDVIVEGKDIFGDGVNVAARLESIAKPGGITISGSVRDHVGNRLDLVFEDLGEQTLKNIERPIRVYSVSLNSSVARDPEDVAPAPQEQLGKERPSIAVLPFNNMSGDAEQEYFSDGITEDIITDLSKVSALSVIARNSAFAFKGKNVDVLQVARQLKVSHVLEGSVRKAGGRVRITAQLIDGARNDHVWAERYDRDLNDIFAIQDEISHAIVDALKVKLLPEEKKAIEQHGTENVDAYNLFLMARQTYTTGSEGDPRTLDAIIRICRRAVEIDPNYADPWALIALSEVNLRWRVGRQGGDGGLAAAERALELNPNLADAYAIKAKSLSEENRNDEASREIEIALRLDPESYQANRCAALLRFRQKRIKEATTYWEKAITLDEGDFGSAGMLISTYTALGDQEGAQRAAKIALERCDKILTRDANNGAAMGHGATALAVLGQRERAKEWMERALLVDPDNVTMRYNFCCALANHLNDKDAALEMLGPALEKMGAGFVNHAKVDPDLDCIRDDPRFKAMLAAAEARVASDGGRDSAGKS